MKIIFKVILCVLLLIFCLFFYGCDVSFGPVEPDYNFESPDTLINEEWSWSYPVANEINPLTEGAIVYVANNLRSRTFKKTLDNELVSYWDNNGAIESYSIVAEFYNHKGEYFGEYYSHVDETLWFGETHANVIYFPSDATTDDTFLPTFSFKLTDVNVNYAADLLPVTNVGDTEIQTNLECFYVYFQTLFNENDYSLHTSTRSFSLLSHFEETYDLGLDVDDHDAAVRMLNSDPYIITLYKEYMKNVDKELRGASRSINSMDLPLELIDMASESFGKDNK